jgi:hypothetical protein
LESLVQEGVPSSVICDFAKEREIEIIVIGSTGTTAAERILIGSSALQIITNAPCIVFIIPEQATFQKIDKIVYATDLSKENLDHINALLPLANSFNTEILFLYIDKNLNMDEVVNLDRVTSAIRNGVNYTKKSGYVCIDTSINTGIDYFMKHHQANCLAMYTHHRGLLMSLFESSITRKIALNNTTPLIVLHDKDIVMKPSTVQIQN